jgi:hypothetical protein
MEMTLVVSFYKSVFFDVIFFKCNIYDNFCTQFQHRRRLGEEERRRKCAAPPNPLKGHGGQKRRRKRKWEDTREDRREDRRTWRPRRVYHRPNLMQPSIFYS